MARIWMTFDGTLSSFVEAATGERLRSRLLTPDTEPSFLMDSEWAKPDEPVLEREVVRYGVTTSKPYYHARSQIAVDRLPAEAKPLLATAIPLASIFRHLAIDTTYLPIAPSTSGPLGDELAPHFDLPSDALCGRLVYDICHAGIAVARLVETFPLANLPTS